MKLFYNPPSPYARKVLVLAHELNLLDRLILIPVDPWKDPPELLAVTPLAKVPALRTENGATLSESTAICEYLARLAGIRTMEGEAWLDLASCRSGPGPDRRDLRHRRRAQAPARVAMERLDGASHARRQSGAEDGPYQRGEF